MVSSGGMLTQKLDANDLQTENKSFDATMVYAQNKRQQIVMTEHFAKKYPDIVFTAMHPGEVIWNLLTPCVANSSWFHPHLTKSWHTKRAIQPQKL